MRDRGGALQIELEERCEAFATAINEAFRTRGAPLRLEHCGSMFYLALPAEHERAGLIYPCLRSRGVHVWDRPFFVSTAHTADDLTHVVRAFDESVVELQHAGFLPAYEARDSLDDIRITKLTRTQPPHRSRGDEQTPTPTTEFELTPVQRETWLATRFGSDASRAQHVSYHVRLRGRIDLSRLDKAFAAVVARHEALRTTIAADGLGQRVHESIDTTIRTSDASQAGDDPDRALTHLLAAEHAELFDLEHGPLVRALLIRVRDHEHVLAITVHHVICDGMSLGTVIADLGALYTANCAPSTLPPAAQFSDFRRYLDDCRADGTTARALSYWREQFFTVPAPLELPTDRPRPPLKTYRGARIRTQVSPSLRDALRELGRTSGCTKFMSLLAAFQILLHRLSGQDDIVVGIPTSAQNTMGQRGIVGHCAHMLPIRSRLAPNANAGHAREFLAATKTRLLAALEHNSLSYGVLLETLRVPRDPSRLPLISVIFNVDPPVSALGFGDLQVELDTQPREYENFDLYLNAIDGESSLTLDLSYNTDLFDRQTMERWLSHYQTLLADMAADLSQGVRNLPLLSDDEIHRALVTWNDTGAEPATEDGIHTLFEIVAQTSPNKIAVVDTNSEWTYAELDARANRVAGALLSRGVASEERVAVCLPRNGSLIATLLGVLKAGAAYVPLDPSYPAARLEHTLTDSGAVLVITDSQLSGALPSEVQRLELDTHGDEIDTAPSTRPVRSPTAPPLAESLAYVIYTSGSTGRPKGVAIEHRSAVALADWARSVYTDDEFAGVLAGTSLCFDLSVFEIFVTLGAGGTLIVADDVLALPTHPAADRVRLVNTVPSAIRALLETNGLPPGVRTVNLAGETLPIELVREIYARTNVSKVYDLYGPSEDTTYSTWTLRKPEDDYNVGRPISGTQAYVLDGSGEIQPIGVPGELHLSGAGLARGYLGDEALTRERFLPHPFREGARIYRTGDLAYYRTDGTLVLQGRIDHQIKLRGFRVELGDIEAALGNIPGVRECAVDLREGRRDNDPRLVAYLACEPTSQGLTKQTVRSLLRETLPEYMVPSVYVELPRLPLTPSGKIDRAALPEPEAAPGTSASATISQMRLRESDEHARGHQARDDASEEAVLEEHVAALWRRELGIADLRLDDDFFDLGGHSLVGVRLISLVNERFGTAYSASALFENPTLRSFTERVAADVNPAGSRSSRETATRRAATRDAGSQLQPAEVAERSADTPDRSAIVHDHGSLSRLVATADTERVRAVVGAARASQREPSSRHSMRRSWIARLLLVPLFAIRSQKFRRLLQYLITRLERAEMFSVSLREVYAKYYDIHVGDYSSGCFCPERVRPGTVFGRYCVMTPTARIENADHPTDRYSTNAVFYSSSRRLGFADAPDVPRKKVTIGNDAFIGHNATILFPTETVGDGAIVGAHAVVSKDVPHYAIVSGFPATVIRYRFSPATIDRLRELAWWDASLPQLEAVKDEFTLPVEDRRPE